MTERQSVRRRSKATPDTLERERQILEHRTAGLTFQAIADRMRLSTTRTHQLYQSALKRIIVEEVDDVRRIETERLDAMLLVCWAQAMQGELKAVDRVLRISESRRKMLGADLGQPIDGAAINAALADAFLSGMKFLAVELRDAFAAAGLDAEVMAAVMAEREGALVASALQVSSVALGRGEG